MPNPITAEKADYKDAAIKICNILQNIAPTSIAQNLIVEKYKEVQVIASNDKEFLLFMVNMLFDGLHYNNWPWNRF